MLRLKLKPKGVKGSPVANIRLAEGTSDLVAQAADILGDSLASDYLRQSYREGETLSNAYARLYARLFADHGLIILDPADDELHRIAAPLFVEAIRRAPELDEALLARNRELRDAGYHEQVKVTDLSTPLFALVDGVRVPVHRANGEFSIGKERLSSDETDSPHRASIPKTSMPTSCSARCCRTIGCQRWPTSEARLRSPTSRRSESFTRSCSAESRQFSRD